MTNEAVVQHALAEVYRGILEPRAPGTVTQVMGPVVDVAFSGQLPAITTLLRARDRTAGLPLEVVQLVGHGVARTVALTSTDGLARGTAVFDTGRPITAPVGPEILGRIFNVLGEPIDDAPFTATRTESIHRAAAVYATPEGAPRLLETGIKAIDLLTPFPRGGKIALFGGAGVGKTVIVM